MTQIAEVTAENWTLASLADRTFRLKLGTGILCLQ